MCGRGVYLDLHTNLSLFSGAAGADRSHSVQSRCSSSAFCLWVQENETAEPKDACVLHRHFHQALVPLYLHVFSLNFVKNSFRTCSCCSKTSYSVLHELECICTCILSRDTSYLNQNPVEREYRRHIVRFFLCNVGQIQIIIVRKFQIQTRTSIKAELSVSD